MVTPAISVELFSTRRAETCHLGSDGWWADRWTFRQPMNHDRMEIL